MNTEICPLCEFPSNEYYNTKKNKTFFLCSHCKAVFAGKQHLPGKDSELKRYNQHNNDVNDVRYQNFVYPIVSEVLTNFTPSDKGLDFGAGPGPVISKLLAEKKYQIKQYDPFYYNYPELLKNKYDYIACCEVIEHFHQPKKDFKLLKKLLAKKGNLYCMTTIYNETINFKNWHYKNDPTHVFFYQTKTLQYICKQFGFAGLEIKNNLIILYN